jgi:integrase
LGYLIATGYTDKKGLTQQYKPATLNRINATISSIHKAANLDSPITKAVRAIVVGYGKTLTDNKPYKQKQAKGLKGVTIVKAINKDTFDTTTNRGTRDKAILLVGFTAALRRNEIASLKVSNLNFDTDGVLISLDNTKTGDRKNYVPLSSDIETCTVTALKKWIAAANLTKTDFLFCSIIKGDTITPSQKIAGETVRRILVATFGTDYSGHSLRVGAAQTAHEAGYSIDACRRLLGHSTDRQTVTYLTETTAKKVAVKMF